MPDKPLFTDEQIRSRVMHTLMQRFSSADEMRQEALADVIGLSAPDLEKEERAALARLVPALPDSIHEKWIRMFSDRLLETIPHNVLSELCLDTEESRATLALTFVMFMESERMEKVMAEDLRAIGVSLSSDDTVTRVGVWLRQHMISQRNTPPR